MARRSYPGSPGPGSFSPSPNYTGGRNAIAETMMQQSPSGPMTMPSSQRLLGYNPNTPPQGAAGTGVAGNRGGTLPWEVETAETGGPTPGWTPDFQGPGDENSFANRFAAGNYFGAGSPSEHITSPYTDAGGRTHQPQIPGGFQTP